MRASRQCGAAAVVVAVTALLTACGGGDGQSAAKATPTASNTWPGGLSPAPDTGSASPTTADGGPYALGKTWHWDDPDWAVGTTTVISYQQGVAKDATQPEEEFGSESAGYVWAAVDLKVCNAKGKTITVNNYPWSLAYKDGSRVQPSSTTYGDFPRPEYPYEDTEVPPGDCVRGKIVFPVPGDERPQRIVYAPEGRHAEWTVPAR